MYINFVVFLKMELHVILKGMKELKKRFEAELRECMSPQYFNLARCLLNWYEKMENSVDGADSWCDTSGHGLTEYWECKGNLLWCWKCGGFQKIFDILMNKFPDPSCELPVMEKTLCGKEVSLITWNQDSTDKVSVRCSDDSLYLADHVIVTVSLGVLKERARCMFAPCLPECKDIAIEGLAMGTVNKIFLQFSCRWWPEDCQGFNFVWDEQDREELIKRSKGGPRDISWVMDVLGFYSVDGQPLCLVGWITGCYSRQLEQLSDCDFLEDVMMLLNKFLGKQYSIPQPQEFKRSCWYSNPYTRGSYSFRSMETERLRTSAFHLSRPLTNVCGEPIVMFAGEATHDHYYSTVHGAIETGWREADRLLKHFSKVSPTRLSLDKPACYQVVIIGAGIAGLAAAKTLIEGGIRNIIILEAQNYAGGRILSLPLNDNEGYVEAGAQWIHGQNNEIWRLANQYNLLSDIVSSEGEGPYIREDGVVFDPCLVFEVYNVVTGILGECEEFEGKKEIPVSIGHHLRQKFVEYLDSCEADTQEKRDMKEELYDWHVRFHTIDNSCSILDKLSAKAWGNYMFCGGTDYVNFKNGYSSLIRAITSCLPSDILQLKCPVKRIRWKGNATEKSNRHLDECRQQVDMTKSNNHLLTTKFEKAVTISHGDEKGKDNENCLVTVTCDNRQFVGQHVIVTCSLGHLKGNYETMFEPALPQYMAQAIQDMGFATINKIFLAFDEAWWNSDIKGFQIIWLKTNTKEPSKDEPSSWTRGLTGFDVLPNHKAVLLGWVGGRAAELVELLSEDEIGRHCTELLRKFNQNPNIPYPHTVIRTQWHSNPYIRGGYSNTTSKCDESRVGPSTLIRPVCVDVTDRQGVKQQQPVLLFAGEATHESFFSTTHGAYATGQRQANVILDYQRTAGKVISPKL